MSVLNHLFFGFAMAFIGVTLPGLINMTSVSMTIRRGLAAGLKYSAGASVTIFLQAFIAVTFAAYLSRHPEIFVYFKQVAIFIFLILSGVFFFQARRPKTIEGSQQQGGAFFLGMAIAGMNILNIPYYFTFSAFLKANEYISLEHPLHLFFILGAMLGALSLLVAYAYFAQYISRRAQFFTRNLNYFLSGLFLLLAMVQGIQVMG